MENAGTIDASRTHSGTRQRMEMLIPPVIGGLVLLIALLGLIGTAIRDPKPHDIAVGLVGPAPAVQQISTAFGTNAPGAFQFTTYGSEADATAALDSRAVDGVLILGGQPRLVVARPSGSGLAGALVGLGGILLPLAWLWPGVFRHLGLAGRVTADLPVHTVAVAHVEHP